MAPDLNAIAAGGKWDYSQPGSSGYDIPNININDPQNRKIRVLTIGAGVSGILMAYQIQRQCENVEHVIYEKNRDIGGTWLENRYPGAACDIPSHAYSYNFALNPQWPRYFSQSPDIWEYLDQVCKVWNLRKFMTFNTQIVGCFWHEDKAQWQVKLKNTESGEEKEDWCDLLLHGTGILNNYQFPKIDGLQKFKGKVIHTANWPKDYQEEQWKNESVAIIGSGASSIQTVPNMQAHVKHMDIFVRTGVWFVTLAGQSGDNNKYPQEEKSKFSTDPTALVAHAKSIEDQVNGVFNAMYKDSPTQQMAQDLYRQRMGKFIKDKRLLDGFTPEFSVGCRRITPGDPYMRAIQAPNVDVHFCPVTGADETGVVGQDGKHRQVDTIVCATGFDVSFVPRFPIIGRNGTNLQDKWKEVPESYLGLAVPEMPNFITFIGPPWPVENGSVMGPLGYVASYAIQAIEKLQREDVRSFVPQQGASDQFNAHVQEWIKHTVWSTNCRAWYRNNDTGRVNAVHCGSSLHYCELIERVRWEDMEIRRWNRQNMWSWLGMGKTVSEAKTDEMVAAASVASEQEAPSAEDRTNGADAANGGANAQEELPQTSGFSVDLLRESGTTYAPTDLDRSPYLALKHLDPQWLIGQCGYSPQKAKDIILDAEAAHARKVADERVTREFEKMGVKVE